MMTGVMTTSDRAAEAGGTERPGGSDRRVGAPIPAIRPRKSSRARILLAVMMKRPVSHRRTVMICESCELTGGPFAPGEAAHLLAIHEQLQHGRLAMHRPPLPPVN
jgi:hypothetical protein